MKLQALLDALEMKPMISNQAESIFNDELTYLDRIRAFLLENHHQLIDLAVFPELGTNEAYGRRVLISNPNFEVMIAGWQKDVECAPHDHGYSLGRVFILEGMFCETKYVWRKNNLMKSNFNVVEAINCVGVTVPDIHSMISFKERGVTLHFYSPAIQDMKVFDIPNRRTLTVSNDCGAWVPDPTQILVSSKWGP